MFKAGADIGGTKINVGLFDAESGELLAREKEYVKNINDVKAYLKEALTRLAHSLDKELDSVSSLGIGIPGTVSDDGKRILKAPNIALLSDNLGAELEDALGIPVGLVQDSRAAAYGEYLASGKSYKNLVCVTLGTGIGTGIVMNGEIFPGALGAAGELGHLPVCEGGRECGCGKRGCLEKYAAGGGLDITARELFGKDKDAKYLFMRVREGDAVAIEAINNALTSLGRGLVSIINLLSPDCVVFSGGLAEEELYLKPLLEYVGTHCYTAGRLPVLKKAELGELSPLYGAAHVDIKRKPRPMLSASVMCADMLNLGAALKEIEESGIDYIHADIMDNHFVPNLMLPMELLNKLRGATRLPFDYHIMAYKPETVIEKLDVREGDFISVHYESTPHLEKVVSAIKDKGARAAVAINPATPISVLDEILPRLDMVLIMSVNPGFAGQKIVPTSFDKLRKMRELLNSRGLTGVLIEVDGNCSFENLPKMQSSGADIFVVGTSSVFKKDQTVKDGVKRVMEILK